MGERYSESADGLPWCVPCDIYPHFASIGAASDAIGQLVADPRIDVFVDDPDHEPPYYT